MGTLIVLIVISARRSTTTATTSTSTGTSASSATSSLRFACAKVYVQMCVDVYETHCAVSVTVTKYSYGSYQCYLLQVDGTAPKRSRPHHPTSPGSSHPFGALESWPLAAQQRNCGHDSVWFNICQWVLQS